MSLDLHCTTCYYSNNREGVHPLVKELLTELALDVGKDWFKDKADEHRLRSALLKYIERQGKYNEVCNLAEEIDFQGLIEYIDQKLLGLVNDRLFAPSPKVRAKARDDIVAAAISYSKADRDQAKRRVAKCIYDGLDLIHNFFVSGISKKEYILASEMVDAIGEDTQKNAEKSTQTVLSRLDDLERNLANGALFSMDKAVKLAETGNYSAIECGLQKMFDHISLEHPMSPHFGFTYVDGKLRSKPLTKEANGLFPPRYVFTGAIRFGDTYYNDPNGDPLDYVYRHQLQIIMEVSSAIKYFGDKPDPVQTEAEYLQGKAILAVPPEFPPAFPCSIKVGEVVFFDYILFRTQEILDDGTYIVSNKEQDINFHFEIRINPEIPSKPDFTINMSCTDTHEMLNFARFMKALSEEKDIHIYVLEARKDIIAGHINNTEYKTGFMSIDEEIDFLERICDIEKYFNVRLHPTGKISEEEYQSVIHISELARKDNVNTIWNEMTFTGILDQHFREGLMEMDTELYMFSYVGTGVVELFGTSFEFKFMRTLKCAHMVDYEKVKKKVEALDDGDSIRITFKAGEDNTAIDTLNIPERFV